ncbi:AAA family ATPase, partial [Flavobacteriaceae bacterium]|nr:AAA family ATPase [Flavobacteriaceae bacterium]
NSLEIDLDYLRKKVEILSPPNPINDFNQNHKKNLHLTRQAERALKTTFLEAKLFQGKSINTAHLLLCILRNENDPTTKLLIKLQLDYESVKEQFKYMLTELNDDFSSSPTSETSPDESKDNEDPIEENPFTIKSDSKSKVKSKTPVLDNFGRDLTSLANSGKLDPVIGREKEIERVSQILSRRKKNNPLLIGEPGVGKSAIAEGLALRIIQKKVSRILYNKRVVTLDLASIVAGTKYRGQFEERMKAVMNEIEKNDDIILFIDEIHTIVGAGGATGRGRIVMRAKAEIEEVNGRECIIVTEIPYQVNKAEMIRKTAEMVNDKKIEGISTIRDESDRQGMRIVYVLKRDAVPNVILNTLFKHTQLQSSFSVNNIALVKGRPQMLNLKQMIGYFVEHRHDVVVRRTKFELKKAEERAHILEGLIIASDNIDKVISLIRSSSNADEAKSKLIKEFKLSEIQSKAIVEMRLRQLTGLEQDKLRGEFDDLMNTIKDLKDILGSEERRMIIIKDELVDIKEKYGDERRSQIEYAGGDLSMEDMIPNEKVVITISNAGYIKRTPLVEYKTQNRGGVGQRGSTTRNEDFLEHLFVGTNHQYMLFFTQKGKCFWMRVFEIPEGSKTSKGRAMQNLINIEQDDEVKAFICTQDLKDEDYINSHYVIMATKKGQVKKTSLEQYSRPRSNGINAITIKDDDELLEAKLTTGNSQVLIAVKSGKCIRFEESKTRPMGRNASGVRGIRLKDSKDEVVGMISVNDLDSDILVVSANGYGKRSSLDDYRITNRGGKGVKTISITEKTGELVTIKNVTDNDDLMIINKSGIAIRMEVSSLRVMGRATQGVKLINLKDSDSIAAVAKVVHDDDDISDVDEIDVVEENNDNDLN